MLPQLWKNNFAAGRAVSPPPPPTSPTSLESSPHYDRLLAELRHAQERRCQLLDEMVALDSPSSARRDNYTLKTVTSSPLPPARRRFAAAAASTNGRQAANYTPSPVSPFSDRFGNYAGHSENGNRARFEKGMAATSSPRPGGGAKKSVRFLDDVSVFGGSAESIGSLLDSHVDLHETAEDIDALITSLTSYDSFADTPPLAPPAPLELRDPAAILKALKSPVVDSGSDEARRRVQDLVDTLISAEVVDQRKNIVHLEPDDPNSIDSGSVLSELDFEETLSNVTIESCKGSPISQTTLTPSRNDSTDLFAEVSDLLERSLQEIRWMEEDNGRIPAPPPPPKPTASGGQREPLYELIGWKRNPPVILPQPSRPRPANPPDASSADVWVPRKDWVPPAAPPLPKNPTPERIWNRRPILNQNGNLHKASGRKLEENPIYGRLWESSSPNRSSTSSNTSSNGDENKQPEQQQQQQQQPADDLTAIRSMARKARLEHWRLTGISPEASGEKASANVAESRLPEAAGTAFLSSLPLFRLPLRKTGSSGSDKTPEAGGIQLTWPPPPLPHSPCPSSATTTPVTPTLPAFPPPEESGCHDSPKCFGHQRIFQWPIPAVKSPKSAAAGSIQRNGSFTKESLPSASGGVKSQQKAQIPEFRAEKQQRAMKPADLEAAQDWYWTEEFPSASGLEPGTGNMTTWFHGAITRAEAENRLTNQPAGAFLTRLTERLWGYALSVRNPAGSVSHFLVDAGQRRRHKKYTLLGSTDPPQKSLRELVQYYGKHPLTAEGGERLLFSCPQESAIGCHRTPASRLRH